MHVPNQRSRPNQTGQAERARPRRTLRLAIVLPAAGGLLIAGSIQQAGAASAAATPPPAAPAHAKPASLGPGLGRPAPDDTVSEAQVCAKVAAKAGFSYSNYISTNNGGSYPIVVI